MAEQFGFILVGMFMGSAIVWFLTRKKVSELEDENKIEQIGERGRFVSYRLKTNG